uniref:Uncharacterized protein n=1 Tax=Chromera velia CCMP2878 TaxID=1169474 RepID=A0A0G4HHQ7_9ALVE|eukprot:Cvel_27561.t1-p1 / transcript=Cvel_27561.t1 / gene=Cvel_27561 / organism=Chromera_velia_CCMP2878 / gene_product=hypothetical protein / transcript_product=hypothetical protein / location=Cvel_scaffold3462:5888-6406(+) / protein_length=173 / sequence_SO=supercontig / SO=protein_coding / is_pseudo=false
MDYECYRSAACCKSPGGTTGGFCANNLELAPTGTSHYLGLWVVCRVRIGGDQYYGSPSKLKAAAKCNEVIEDGCQVKQWKARGATRSIDVSSEVASTLSETKQKEYKFDKDRCYINKKIPEDAPIYGPSNTDGWKNYVKGVTEDKDATRHTIDLIYALSERNPTPEVYSRPYF